jgi:nucleotide-binding universal stress UspA family protein
MYERILLPTDGGPGTDAAVGQAVGLARRCRAALHVLHVVDTSVLPLDRHSRELVADLEEWGVESIEKVATRARAEGVEPVVDALRQGAPAAAILDYVDEADIDLVVMATHGGSGLRRYLLGSVTARIVRTSPVPVLVVPVGAAESD